LPYSLAAPVMGANFLNSLEI